MPPQDRERLRTILLALDEVGLVALANKGLVRRASKDLSVSILCVEEGDDALIVQGPDFTVTMPADGPAKAKDDTRATGVTRQVLMAAMFLRDGWAALPPPPSDIASAPLPTGEAAPGEDIQALESVLLSITHEQLKKWAGKNIWRDALFLVKSKPRLEVEKNAGIAIRFVDHEIEFRILPGSPTAPAGLLNSALTTASRSAHALWVVATVLAFQQHAGKELQRPEESILAETKDAPLIRLEVLNTVRRLLDTAVNTGLAHPSGRLQERLLTLSISALGVHLPRLSRLLRALADEVTLLLGRDAKADNARLFDRMCLTLAITQALIQAGDKTPIVLAGRPRTEYEPVGDLALVGIAAYPWQTASGFHGLTLLCWDEVTKVFRTWSTSRAANAPGRFDLRQAYQTDAVWPGAGAPEKLSRSRFLLRGARANYQGRLSASQGTSVSVCEPAAPHQLDLGSMVFRSWAALGDYARRVAPLGLRELNPLDAYVVIRPVGWGQCVFDELRQRLLWSIADENGESLPLALPWTSVNENAIEFLEKVRPDRDRLVAVVGRLVFNAAGLSVEPLALWSEGTPANDHVLNPAFDAARIKSSHSTLLERLREKYGRNVLATTMQTDEEDSDWLAPFTQVPMELEKRLTEIDSLLGMWAERGNWRASDTQLERLRLIASRLSKGGFDLLSRSLSQLETGSSGLALLWCGYLQRTYRQAQVAEQLYQAAMHI